MHGIHCHRFKMSIIVKAKLSARSFCCLTFKFRLILHPSFFEELIVAFNSSLSSSDLDNLNKREKKQRLNTKVPYEQVMSYLRTYDFGLQADEDFIYRMTQ